MTDAPMDQCIRCDYDLRGIADEAPCPECGLLALRSRRPSDELCNSRPNWLRIMSAGIFVMLLGLLAALLYQGTLQLLDLRIWELAEYLPTYLHDYAYGFLPWLGDDVLLLSLPIGIFLATWRDRTAVDDLSTKRRRRWLRISSPFPLLFALAAQFVMTGTVARWRLAVGLYSSRYAVDLLAVSMLLTAAPIPWLLFQHFRSLARRARSAHLAEHCTIVGFGASLSLLYIVVLIVVSNVMRYLDRLEEWESRSQIALVMILLFMVASGLCLLWSIYLMVRFGISFRTAARELRQRWRTDDHSMGPV